MPENDPTTDPVDFPTWIAWRMRQPNPPASTPAALDETHKLAVFGIYEITEEIPAGLLHERGSVAVQVVSPQEVAVCELCMIKPPDMQAVEIPLDRAVEILLERVLVEPEVVLAPLWFLPPTIKATVHRGLRFRVADAARFGELITSLTPPTPIPHKLQRVSKEQLLSWLKENYSERPIEKDFISAAKRHFKRPYWDVRRAAARDALKSKDAADFFKGPTTRRLRGRPLS